MQWAFFLPWALTCSQMVSTLQTGRVQSPFSWGCKSMRFIDLATRKVLELRLVCKPPTQVLKILSSKIQIGKCYFCLQCCSSHGWMRDWCCERGHAKAKGLMGSLLKALNATIPLNFSCFSSQLPKSQWAKSEFWPPPNYDFRDILCQ